MEGTQGSNANPLQQKFAASHSIDRADTKHSPLATNISRTQYDFENEDVLEHDVQSLEALSDIDPKFLASVEKVGAGTKLKSDTRKGVSSKWKRSTKKQFTEDPELYLRPYMDTAIFIGSVSTKNSSMILNFMDL